MSLWLTVPLWLAGALLLWAAGAVAFDAVHWLLHRMLRSRVGVIRALAWPHAVHHRWLDRTLTIRWEQQIPNVWCHLVPEYLTQLAFSAAAALVAPLPVVVGCVGLQTTIFVGMLAYRGLDINHRGVVILDAFRPSVLALPAYHALHHVYPDAYFSAYGKLVDWVVGGGIWLRGRRVAIVGPPHAFARALARELQAAGAVLAEPGDLAHLDVLVLADPAADAAEHVEPFIRMTRARQLPPEAWVVRDRADDGVARHYHDDVRVIHRTLVVPDGAALGGPGAARMARTAMCFIRRGACFVPTRWSLGAWRDFAVFRRTPAAAPPGATLAPTRAALATA